MHQLKFVTCNEIILGMQTKQHLKQILNLRLFSFYFLDVTNMGKKTDFNEIIEFKMANKYIVFPPLFLVKYFKNFLFSDS